MGVWDAITEVLEAAIPWGEANAEAPAEEPQVGTTGMGDWGNWSSS